MTTVQVCRAAVTVFAIAVAGLVMSACGGRADAPAGSITGTFGGDALLEGGCAWIDAEQRWEVRYPDGYTVEFEPLRLVDAAGAVVAEEGDTLQVSGSEATDAVSACQIGPLWVATEVTPG